ncbi:unnamed protein product [Gongylonema pulchrum]|uniref:VCBS repeat-containing protein n=1 Tax=Gongylonema pulchrum TaxID=637853 RepID=A0A183DV94_9BILA|nr:unnamed protein product [Gongylonema pulchrum]
MAHSSETSQVVSGGHVHDSTPGVSADLLLSKRMEIPCSSMLVAEDSEGQLFMIIGRHNGELLFFNTNGRFMELKYEFNGEVTAICTGRLRQDDIEIVATSIKGPMRLYGFPVPTVDVEPFRYFYQNLGTSINGAHIADINGDGVDELGPMRLYGFPVPTVDVEPSRYFYQNLGTSINGAHVADINGDGVDELVVFMKIYQYANVSMVLLKTYSTPDYIAGISLGLTSSDQRYALLRQLPPHERDVLRLCFASQLSHTLPEAFPEGQQQFLVVCILSHILLRSDAAAKDFRFISRSLGGLPAI